jgi:intraflagellar transport protein 172
LGERERSDLYISLGRKYEEDTYRNSQRLNEAETLYLAADDPDLAINMYKQREDYENMLRLVSKFRREHLPETYKYVAEQSQLKGNLKRAEHYYVEAKNWAV